MRNIKKQNVKRNPRVTRSTAHRKAHPSSGRPKPIRSKKITRRPGARRGIHSSLPRAYAEVSPKAPPKAPPKVNPKVTRTHQVRHTTRNVQDANALGKFTADVGHGARTTVESYNFINPQTRSLRESTLFEVGVGTLTGQYTPEQGWGEAGRRVTEQPGRVVGEAAVEVGTALIPVGALFKAAKIGSAVRKANFLVKPTRQFQYKLANPLKDDPFGPPRNYGDKKLKDLEDAAPVATKAFREAVDYGATWTTYTDNTASAIRLAKGSFAKQKLVNEYGIVATKTFRARAIHKTGKKSGSLVEDVIPTKIGFTRKRKKILPGLYKETEITPVGAFTEKTKVITTPPGKTTGSSKPPYAFTETGMKGPYSKYYTKPGKDYEVEDWQAGGPQYAPVEYKDVVYFSAPVRVKGLTKKLKKAEERGAVIKTEKTLVPYGKWYTVTPEQVVKGQQSGLPTFYEISPGSTVFYNLTGDKLIKESAMFSKRSIKKSISVLEKGENDDTRIILNTKWKYEDVPVSVTETRYTGPVANLGRTAPIIGTIGASTAGVIGYGEFSDSSIGQGQVRTKIKKAVGAI